MSIDKYYLTPSEWIMIQSLSWPKGGRVLDFASGYGRHSLALAKQFNVVAVDQNKEALATLAGHPNIKTIECDLETEEKWPFFYDAFNVVIVTNYLYRPKLKKLFNLVAKKGFIAYETFADGNEAFGHPKNPDFLLRKDELLHFLPNNFELIDFFHGTVSIPRPAIIQRLAAQRRT